MRIEQITQIELSEFVYISHKFPGFILIAVEHVDSI
jgi:hypothetical protein